MSSFKSWLVANVEVILILFTVLFLIITSLIMIPKIVHGGDKSIIDGYVAILISSILLCSIFVSAIRHGFVAFIAAVVFIGYIGVQIVNDHKADNQHDLATSSTQIVSNDTSSDSDDVGLYLINAGRKFKLKWLIWVCIPAAIFGIFTSIYANINFEDVVSRRFFYRHSNVEVFEVKWKYTFNRLYAGFVTILIIGLEIILFFLFQP